MNILTIFAFSIRLLQRLKVKERIERKVSKLWRESAFLAQIEQCITNLRKPLGNNKVCHSALMTNTLKGTPHTLRINPGMTHTLRSMEYTLETHTCKLK